MEKSDEVTCPRCGSAEIYYHDVNITVDYDYLTWSNGEMIVWSENTYDREYFDIPDNVTEFPDGLVQCDRCHASWTDLDALNKEVLATKISAVALDEAEEAQFGVVGNYAGLEVY